MISPTFLLPTWKERRTYPTLFLSKCIERNLYSSSRRVLFHCCVLAVSSLSRVFRLVPSPSRSDRAVLFSLVRRFADRLALATALLEKYVSRLDAPVFEDRQLTFREIHDGVDRIVASTEFAEDTVPAPSTPPGGISSFGKFCMYNPQLLFPARLTPLSAAVGRLGRPSLHVVISRCVFKIPFDCYADLPCPSKSLPLLLLTPQCT